jgi:hypothetical protein
MSEPRFKAGDVVLINGTLTKNIAGKITTVLTTYPGSPSYSYIVEYFSHVNDVQWEVKEREFPEHMLLPLDDAARLIYLDYKP